MFQSNMITR